MVLGCAVPLLCGAALSLLYNHIPISYDGVDTFSGIVIRSSANYFVLQTWRGRFYIYNYGNTFELLDIVKVSGSAIKYFHANYESQFDFGEYLRLQGVTYEVKAYSKDTILAFPIRMREYAGLLTSGLNEDASALFKSLLFNQKDYSSSLLSNANAVGVSYIVSSSGIFYMGILSFARKRFHYFLNDKYADACTIGLGSLLLIFGITKTGIVRAYVCLWMRFINKYRFKERFERPEVLSFSGLAMLIMNPFLASDSGFLLGFGVSFAMFYGKYILLRYGKKESKIAAMFLIRLIIFPISVSSAGYRPLAFLYTLLLTPLSWIGVIIGYPSVIFHFGKGMLNGYASFYGTIVKWMDANNPALPIPILGTGFYFVYYVALFLCLFFIEVGAYYLKNKLIIALISTYLVSLVPAQYLFTAQVSFINVGQGDSILIRHRSSVVMIDTGGVVKLDMANDTLIPFLRKQRIYHIDCLIGTHGDYDHIGAKDELMKNFNVKRYVDDASEFPLTVGQLTFTNYNVYEGSDENENSLVLKTEILGKSWLFTGDAGVETEEKIVRDFPDLDVDMLKLGHHGSKSSSSEDFLKLLSPEMVIISVGRGNKYGHPDPEVIKRLEKLNIPYRRTDLEGTITYYGFA
ncbi:MAG: ComEC/Rec2 family competence protein [Bacilli bacterium]|nr:ComEC/Rec2 family competence protein [Bacilli bacterium]